VSSTNTGTYILYVIDFLCEKIMGIQLNTHESVCARPWVHVLDVKILIKCDGTASFNPSKRRLHILLQETYMKILYFYHY
jgi:hypothetical protein